VRTRQAHQAREGQRETEQEGPVDRPPLTALGDGGELGRAVAREVWMQYARHHRKQRAEKQT